MKTENQRSYNTGFVLTEPELRRIHQLIIEQFQRHLGSTANIKVSYEIRYRNGSISEPNSLDTIIAQENIGSSAITRLGIRFTDDNNPFLYDVTLRFINLDLENYGSKSISYTVIGNDRDWVFIITSLLDDRIKRIKRFRIYTTDNFMSLFFAMFFSLFLLTIVAFPDSKSQELSKLKLIEQNYKNGKFKNPIEALIEIEKYKIDANYSSMPPMNSMAGVGIILALIIVVFATVHYCFPSYNFCWGEYIAFKKRRESIGKFIIVTVILSLLLGVITNYISARLGI
jgi:hypothetical protein